ncbi:hypothetical protein HZQ28_00990 [Elizabethkingia anophelis]|nr:hypothetical protein [Elizabethkingia anophelis]MCT3993065.1 hypothetical protein [Elizabethkingia anophelis]MCT3997122.1 hypothetical protein [Elizabethkingia anophelis]
MKASNNFEEAIKTYLDEEKKTDTTLEQALTKEGKTLTDCCSYIMKKVNEMKVTAMTSDEVFALAKEYFLDEKLTSVKKPNGKVVVGNGKNTTPPENKQKQVSTSKPKTAIKDTHPNQMSIFDLL